MQARSHQPIFSAQTIKKIYFSDLVPFTNDFILNLNRNKAFFTNRRPVGMIGWSVDTKTGRSTHLFSNKLYLIVLLLGLFPSDQSIVHHKSS